MPGVGICNGGIVQQKKLHFRRNLKFFGGTRGRSLKDFKHGLKRCFHLTPVERREGSALRVMAKDANPSAAFCVREG